jgi:hypothetical protein
VAKLADRITETDSFRVLLATSERPPQFGRGLQLPPKCGGLRLTEIAKAQLVNRPHGDTVYALAATVRANSSVDETSAIWNNIRPISKDDDLWFSIGHHMGVVDRLSTHDCISLVEQIGDNAGVLLFLDGRGDVFEAVPGLSKTVFGKMFESGRPYYGGGPRGRKSSRGQEIIHLMTSAQMLLTGVIPLREVERAPEQLLLRDVIRPWSWGSERNSRIMKRLNDEYFANSARILEDLKRRIEYRRAHMEIATRALVYFYRASASDLGRGVGIVADSELRCFPRKIRWGA